MSEARARNLDAGIEMLQGWLADQLRLGLAALEADAPAQLAEIAARLTDAQLPGPAGALRDWAKRIGHEPEWATAFLQELGYWYLACTLGRQREQLPDGLRDSVLDALGCTIRGSEVEAGPAVAKDVWVCVGQELGENANIHYRRTYWRGSTAAEHWAVQLDYQYGSPLPPTQVEVATAGEFAVKVYPGGLPGRILAPAEYSLLRLGDAPHHVESWAAQRRATAELLARRPLTRETPLAVGPLRLRLVEHELHLLDGRGEAVTLSATEADRASWQLMAIGVGAEVAVYGVLRRGRLVLHAAWVAGELSSLG